MESKEILTKVIDSFNQQKPEQVKQYLDPDAKVTHSFFKSPATGPQAVEEINRVFKTAFGDSLRIQTEDVLSSGNVVAARTTLKGTHQGPFLGNPGTNQSFSGIPLIFWARVAGNKITELYVIPEVLMLQQKLQLSTLQTTY